MRTKYPEDRHMPLTEQLAKRYNNAFPKYPPLAYTKQYVYGMWMIGNDYRNTTKFYGAYPRGLLKRYNVMFRGIKGTTLHLFSGSLPPATFPDDYTRFDITQTADVRGDAHKLSNYFEPNKFGLIYADPPYSKADAVKYGTPMVNRYKVMREIPQVLQPGGLLVWLDTTYPMFRKNELSLIGTIGVIRSTNHRVRAVFIFQKGVDTTT